MIGFRGITSFVEILIKVMALLLFVEPENSINISVSFLVMKKTGLNINTFFLCKVCLSHNFVAGLPLKKDEYVLYT